MADLRQTEQERKRKREGKRSGGWWIVILFVIGLLSEMTEDGGAITVGVYLAIIAIAILITALVRAAKKRAGSAGREAPAAARTGAAVRRPDPRTKSFTKPDAHCVVCDHTGEDHFVRDKARRIAQLDDWLKNGLIDRDEYRVLKERYENDL